MPRLFFSLSASDRRHPRRRGPVRRGPPALERLEDRTAPAVLVNQVKVINTQGNSNPSNGVNLNGTVLFAADDGTDGTELWKSDGTAAGTQLVKDINPGQTNGIPNSSNPSDLTVAGNTVFFLANKTD